MLKITDEGRKQVESLEFYDSLKEKFSELSAEELTAMEFENHSMRDPFMVSIISVLIGVDFFSESVSEAERDEFIRVNSDEVSDISWEVWNEVEGTIPALRDYFREVIDPTK